MRCSMTVPDAELEIIGITWFSLMCYIKIQVSKNMHRFTLSQHIHKLFLYIAMTRF